MVFPTQQIMLGSGGAKIGTEGNPGTNAQEIYDSGQTTDGFYWIQSPGMANKAQIWCDMTSGHSSAGGVGGWNRFWWYGTYEQTNGSPASFPTGDCFGVADVSTATHTATSSFSRIPSGVTPQWLMVKGNSPDVTLNGNLLRYVIWEFTNASTPNAAKAAMQSGTVRNNSSNPGSNWQPTYNQSANSSWPYGDGTLDSFWYSDDWQNGRGKGFNLDDDGHYGNTAFSGGRDHAGVLGIDFMSGSPNNGQGYNLNLFWK